MKQRARVYAAIILTMGLAAACTSADDAPDPPAEPDDGVATDHQPDEPPLAPGEDESPEPIPGQDGAATALSTAADELGGLAFELERGDDDGEDHWEVTVAVDNRAVEMHVSIDGNAVISGHEAGTLDEEDRQRLDAASVAASEAAVIAAQHLGGTVEQVDLEDDGDAVVWEIELLTTDGASTDVRVDAATGEVL